MKHLLILFLFTCSVVNGQRYMNMFSDTSDMRIYIPADLMDEQNIIRHIDYEITLQDLLDYQEECYRDSTFTHTYSGYTWPNGCFEYDIHWHSKPKLICMDKKHFTWKHKQPTFEGFIEFMKRRYK